MRILAPRQVCKVIDRLVVDTHTHTPHRDRFIPLEKNVTIVMQLLKLCARSLSSRELEAELKTWNSETQTSFDYMKNVSTFRTFRTAGPFPDMVASCLWVFRWNRILLDTIGLYVLSFVDFHIKTREPCFMFCFFFPIKDYLSFALGRFLNPKHIHF